MDTIFWLFVAGVVLLVGGFVLHDYLATEQRWEPHPPTLPEGAMIPLERAPLVKVRKKAISTAGKPKAAAKRNPAKKKPNAKPRATR